ncbi:hypothetical protein JYU34_021199 [Plutella xylostella]|uniref:Uncharacterized protein n=1 Tax=Plutella xylostella TaxID=51655 RepID=A0ABQ7PUB3_PLUXY|nr:hypothetical protein JYU34_021199 [Plutella xylostella]
MLFTIVILCVVSCASSHLGPVIYAAPSAVSHQSRIDIKHTPVLSAPLIYSPTIYATHPRAIVADTVLTPVVPVDTVFSPVALGVFHNLPLARALKHPVSIEKAQQEAVERNKMKSDKEKSSA